MRFWKFAFWIAAAISATTASAGYGGYRYITKDQEKLLKSSKFLTRDYIGTSHQYRPYIDFAIDCGVSNSVVEANLQSFNEGKMRSFLIDDVSNLVERVGGYPFVLKALGKWDSAMQQRHADLTTLKDALVAIARKPISASAKLKEAEAPLNKAEQVSKEMAEAGGVEFEGGCGAGPEDSQIVDFAIMPKPKSAFIILEYDFDMCKRVLREEAVNPTKCDAWGVMQPKGNELSGSYRYRVTWDDGAITESKFSALGTKRKTVQITK